jgi:uncharacterized membrane protein
MITAPWRSVPPGTNGGVSLLGTVASAAGGAIIATAMAFDLWLEKGLCLVTSEWEFELLQEGGRLVAYGTIAGLIGSLVSP